jgi:hypothetical protein
VEIRFTAGGGVGRTTVGQANVLRWLADDEDPRAGVLPAFVPVPPGHPVGDLAGVVERLVVRHEALRTVFPAPGVQEVRAAGTLELRVHDVPGDWRPAFAAVVWAALAEPADPTRDPPVRALAAVRGGEPCLLVLLISHAAVDAAGAAIVAADGAALLAGQELPPPGRQPRDQAVWEASGAGRRSHAGALAHWGRTLRRIPPAGLAEPHPDGRPGQVELRMRSAALAAALPVVSARTGAGPSTVLLAAQAVLVAGRTGRADGAIVSICGNRFRSGWRDYVGPLAQDALIPYEVGGSFADVVRQVAATALAAYRHGQFDPAELWPLIERVDAERGTPFARDVVFNDLGAYTDVAAPPAGPPGPTVVEPLPARTLPTRLVLTLAGLAGGEVDLRIHADTRYVPDPEAVLRGIERLVLDAAGRPAGTATPAAGTAAGPSPRVG